MTSPSSDTAPGTAEPTPAPGRRFYVGLHRAPHSVVWRAALIAVPLLVLGLVALLLWRPWSGTQTASRGDAPSPALADVAPDVADWVQQQVPDDTPVTGPDALRSALDGSAADRFTADAADGALQVVTGRPPDGALVLAVFQAPDGTVASLVDPAPGRPTQDELDRRRSLSGAVLVNPVAGVTGRAADMLRAAHIDARLLGLLAGSVSRLDAHVADLPAAPGEPADGPPARWLLVDEVGGTRLAPGAQATDDFVAFLEAQRPPFAPDTIEATDDGVLVGFDYVSAPDAVVSAATS